MKRIQLGGHKKRNGIKKIDAWTLVDDEDFEWLNQWKWRLNSKGYAFRTEGTDYLGTYKRTWMHRQIMNAPKRLEVDHIDHNPLNNQRNNLRLVTHSQNAMNKNPIKSTFSGFVGVKWEKRRLAWIATIKVNKKQIYLGQFPTKNEAINIRKQAEIKYFGNFRYKD